MNIDIRLLSPDEVSVLDHVAPEVFDYPVDSRWSSEFFADSRHHLAVAIDDGTVVGMASAVHYVHPDQLPQLWINEVAVAPTHQAQGIGRRMLEMLLSRGRELQCSEAWVLTDWENKVAQRLYASVGGVVPPEECIMFTIPLNGKSTQ